MYNNNYDHIKFTGITIIGKTTGADWPNFIERKISEIEPIVF